MFVREREGESKRTERTDAHLNSLWIFDTSSVKALHNNQDFKSGISLIHLAKIQQKVLFRWFWDLVSDQLSFTRGDARKYLVRAAIKALEERLSD